MRYNRFHRATGFLTPTLYTQQLGEFASGLSFEEIPPEVIRKAKELIVHTMGAAFAAKGTPVAEKARKMALEANGGEGGPVTMWTTGEKAGAANAALALGTMADVLDWESFGWTGPAAASLIPCAWLAAEEKHRSGKDLLRAVVAGYEVYQRIAMTVQPNEKRWEKGWGVTSWQMFAAVLPIAVLYGFDARKINQVIGVACETSTLPTRYHLTTMSDFRMYEYGLRSRDGFMSCKAVEKGIHNCLDALDESRCYRGIICGEDAANGDGDQIVSADESDPGWFTRELGERYLLTEAVQKRWSANLWAQAACDCVSELKKEYGIEPGAVAEILLDSAVDVFADVPEEGYTSALHAQSSIPYAIACVLKGLAPGSAWYTAEQRNDPETVALARKVQIENRIKERDAFVAYQQGEFPGAEVTVVLTDGKRYSKTVSVPAGHPTAPFSEEDAVRLFRSQTEKALSAEQADAILKAVAHLEDCADVAELSDRLFKN